jgi:hypothetical protein
MKKLLLAAVAVVALVTPAMAIYTECTVSKSARLNKKGAFEPEGTRAMRTLNSILLVTIMVPQIQAGALAADKYIALQCHGGACVWGTMANRQLLNHWEWKAYRSSPDSIHFGWTPGGRIDVIGAEIKFCVKYYTDENGDVHYPSHNYACKATDEIDTFKVVAKCSKVDPWLGRYDNNDKKWHSEPIAVPEQAYVTHESTITYLLVCHDINANLDPDTAAIGKRLGYKPPKPDESLGGALPVDSLDELIGSFAPAGD